MSPALKLKTKKGFSFFIDKEDAQEINKFIWRFDHGYIRTNTTYLHRMLLGFPKGNIDHIDGNPLNNQRSNLRICTQQANLMNKRKTSIKKSSIFKGVSWCRKRKLWIAHIMKNYKSYYIGGFKKEIEAANAYNKKAIEFFAQFARLN